MQIATMAQYNMYAFFDTIPDDSKQAVYTEAMRLSAERMKGQTHDAPRSIQ